ncbi:MAG: hypothetical protein QOC82_3334 [Frankiaceae bacterium]|jgi:hypothetical protein|nr:hypothetical protein [Frankiaceae bacterium]
MPTLGVTHDEADRFTTMAGDPPRISIDLTELEVAS